MLSSNDPIDFCDQSNRVNNDWKLARKEFLKTKLKFQAVESLVISQEIPTELRRRPDIFLHLTEDLFAGSTQARSKTKLDKTSVDIINSHIKKLLLARSVALLTHWPSSSGDSGNEYVRSAALPELVRGDLESLRSSRTTSKNDDYSSGSILDRHFTVLASVCQNHCLGTVHTYNSVKLEYNLAKKKTLELKLNYLRQEVLAQTYTPQATKALEKIRSQILLSLKEVRDEVEKIRSSVSQYQSIGPEFETIVERFAKIQKEIEGKKWALKELKSK